MDYSRCLCAYAAHNSFLDLLFVYRARILKKILEDLTIDTTRV
jgi:hypothetical protein